MNKSLLGLAQIGWFFLIGFFVRLRLVYSDESFNCTGCSGTLTRMRYPRVIDQLGNKTDCETKFLSRIGERIQLEYAEGRGAVQTL